MQSRARRRQQLSGYRIMWTIVMFDLPVGLPKERKAATLFRKHLLDLGFSMAQFSVYYRVMGNKDIAQRYIVEIKSFVPENGSVNILTITDKQYENMICFLGQKLKAPPKTEQLALF